MLRMVELTRWKSTWTLALRFDMSIVLFAIIGAKIHAGTAYWICYGLFCFGKVVKVIFEAVKED